MPEGAAVEQTSAVLGEMADYLLTIDEVTDVQAYAGTRRHRLVSTVWCDSITCASKRILVIFRSTCRTNIIANATVIPLHALRAHLRLSASRHGAAVKVVEVPPGPPVMAPLVAEVYGPDYGGQMLVAKKLREQFLKTDGLVEIDDSIERASQRMIVAVDRSRAAQLGIAQADVVAAVSAALGGEDVTYLRTGHAKYPVPVRLELTIADKSAIERVLAIKLRSRSGALVPMSEVVSLHDATWENTIYHKDLLPVVYVTADMAGKLDSPLYGMFDMVGAIGDSLQQFFIRQPSGASDYSVKWDGEWQITYETFRDMGAAYSVGLVLIFLLVVGQFRSYAVPLVIMAPIAFTLVGIMPASCAARCAIYRNIDDRDDCTGRYHRAQFDTVG